MAFVSPKTIFVRCVMTMLAVANAGLSAQLGMGVAPVSEYLRSGLRVGLGTGLQLQLHLDMLF